MTRPAMVIAVALGFLTAFVVGELGFLVAGSTVERPRTTLQAIRAEPVVEAFYAGINAWIATEDRSLELVLAPAFVDHTTSDDPDRNDQEFFAYLNAVRPRCHRCVSKFSRSKAPARRYPST